MAGSLVEDREKALESFNEGKKILQENKRSYIKAAYLFEKSYNLLGENSEKDSEFYIELIEYLFDSSYRAIWGSYSVGNYELMEHFARVYIGLSQKNKSDILKLAKAFNGLSLSLYKLGRANIEYNIKASEYFKKILESNENDIDKPTIAKSKIKNDIGIVIYLGFENKFKEAEVIILECINEAQRNNLEYEKGICFKIYGELLYYFEYYEKGFEHFNKSIAVFKNKNSKKFQNQLLELFLHTAFNYYNINNIYQSIKYLKDALDLSHKLSIENYKIPFIYALLFETEKSYSKSYKFFTESYNLLEKSKEEIKFESNVDSFLKHKEKEIIFLKTIYYSFLFNEINVGLKFLENYRNRVFLENILSNEKENLGGIPFHLKEERDNIIDKLNDLRRKIKDDEDENNDLSSEIDKLENNLYYCEEKISLVKKSYNTIIEKHEFDLESFLPYVKNNKCIIEYFYYQDKLFIFVLKNGKINSVVNDYNLNKTTEVLEGFQLKIKQSYSKEFNVSIFDYYINKFLEILYKPIERHLSDVNELIIIPYREYHNFPFQLIFGDKINFSILPSLSIVKHLPSKKIDFSEILCVSNPKEDLKSSENEVNSIIKLFNRNKVLNGKNVISDIVTYEMSRYKNFHYSGHIFYNKDKPLYSYLECNKINELKNENYDYEKGKKDRIELKDIYNLEMGNVDFVCLGGCSSGRANIYSGEEIIGMIRGFFYAGVKSILSTMWDIEDQSSSDFLITFYNNLKELNGNKRQAYFNTFCQMKEKYKSPFHYGPFALYEGFSE